MTRDFTAELQAARNAQDWAAHERIWEERRVADVEQDERELSVTFTGLRDAVDQMDVRPGTLASRLDHVLDRARINADDIVYVEKAAPAAEWGRLALDTVSSELSYSTDEEVIDWFTTQGVRF